MRVHSIDAIPIDIPLARNFGGSTYAVLKRSTVITRLATDDGIVSEVYNGDNREHGPEIARIIREVLAPHVRGFDVFERERVWSALFALTHASRDRKTLLEAIACVDCAMWDVVGKAEGRSVCELLGGTRRALPIITIGGYYREGKTLADVGREIEAYRAAASSRWAASRRRTTPPGWRWPGARPVPTSSWPSTPTAAGRPRTPSASRT